MKKRTQEMTPRELTAAVAAAEAEVARRRTRANRVQSAAKRVSDLIAPAIDAHRAAEAALRSLKDARTLRRGIPNPVITLRKRYVRWRFQAFAAEGLAPWQRKRARKRMDSALRKLQRCCPHPFILDCLPPDPKKLAAADIVTDGYRECAFCTVRERRTYAKGTLTTTLCEAAYREFAVVDAELFDALAWHLRRFSEMHDFKRHFRSIAAGFHLDEVFAATLQVMREQSRREITSP